MQGTPRPGAARSSKRGKAITFYVSPGSLPTLEALRRRWSGFDDAFPYGKVLDRLLAVPAKVVERWVKAQNKAG